MTKSELISKIDEADAELSLVPKIHERLTKSYATRTGVAYHGIIKAINDLREAKETRLKNQLNHYFPELAEIAWREIRLELRKGGQQ